MQKDHSSRRLFFLSLLLVAVVIVAPFVSYLSVVFGWTNPTQNPPNGSGLLTRLNNYLGVNTTVPSTTLTVNGQISASGNKIIDVATPVNGTDAVNKDYLSAQLAAAGGGVAVTTVTLYGVSTAVPQSGAYLGPGGAVPACLRGYAGATSCGGNIGAAVAAGSGTPACSSLGSDWSEVYAGYGPLNVLYSWYVDIAPEESNEATAPWETWTLSDSICSTASYAYIRNIQTGQNVVANSQAFTAACTLNACNTCRVCMYTTSTTP